jgi:hypothetical protein
MKNLFLLGILRLILASCSKKNEIKDLPKTENQAQTTAIGISQLLRKWCNSGNDANAGTSAATA